jgi:hypothetical protein
MIPNRWFPFEGHGMRFLGRDFGFPIPLLPWLPSSWSAQIMVARKLCNVVASVGFEIQKVDYVLPVFEVYQWLPASVITTYRRPMPRIEKTPLGKFGVSTLIAATGPIGQARTGDTLNRLAICSNDLTGLDFN